ncbi:MAG: hypothetical protein IPK26_30070 [Planctomycetes bacterium]|nr:hypothetical protein [Planctomycetota bacterium]
MKLRVAVSLLCSLCLRPTTGQAPVVSAAATLVADANGVLDRSGPAPLPAGGAAVSAVGVQSTASAGVGWLPAQPIGTVALGLRVTGSALLSWTSGSGQFQCSAQVDLQIAETATGWTRLRLRHLTNGGTLFGGSVTIDVGVDGVLEYSGSGATAEVRREFVVRVPAGGTVVRMAASSGGVAVFYAIVERTEVDLSVAVEPPPLVPYGSACMALTGDRPSEGQIRLRCQSGGAEPVLFIAGLTSMAMPLPWAPYCQQLTEASFVAAVPTLAGIATLNLPDLAPPPGVALHVQGVAFLADGRVLTSNGLRLAR